MTIFLGEVNMGLVEINNKLTELDNLLQRIESEYPTAARQAARSRLNYDLAKATQYDTIEHRAIAEGEKKPTVAAIDAEVAISVAAEREAARIDEAELDILVKLLKVTDMRLSAAQTQGKIAGLEIGLSGYKT